MSKILIAYYSRRGQNYVNGSITDLKVGDTEVVASKIKAITGGDLFLIDTVEPYPADYLQTTRVAKEELRSNARPLLTDSVSGMDRYDTIYLGYPNWWGTFPMAVFTFLESYSFAGKTIIPFCTHEGSGLGNSEKDIKRLCPDATVEPGIQIRGSAADQSDSVLNRRIGK